ncbi:MAG: 50S ribosomal protein L25 [Patescibacteria group bacterium]
MKLIVQKREIPGKKPKQLREEGLIPGELYGYGTENIHVSIPEKDFARVFKAAGESSLVDIEIAGKSHSVVIHDVVHDSVTDKVIAVDFYQVNLNEPVEVSIPFNFIGIPPAVKDFGGNLVKTLHELAVKVLPNNIPHAIDVDLSALREIGNSVHIKDIVIPKGVQVLISEETVLATVTPPVAEEEPVQEISIDSVKVETEEKKAERVAKKEAEAGESAS